VGVRCEECELRCEVTRKIPFPIPANHEQVNPRIENTSNTRKIQIIIILRRKKDARLTSIRWQGAGCRIPFFRFHKIQRIPTRWAWAQPLLDSKLNRGLLLKGSIVTCNPTLFYFVARMSSISFFKKKPAGSQSLDGPVAEPAPEPPTNYVVMLSVEKDISIGPKRTVSVPLTIPAVPNLELSWELSVLRSNIGVSATFAPDQFGEKGQLEAEETKQQLRPFIVSSTLANGGNFGGSPDSGSEKSFRNPRNLRNLFRRQSSRANSSAASEAGSDEDDLDTVNLPDVPIAGINGAVAVKDYERVNKGTLLEGVYRFDGKGGRLVFVVDNSFAKARRKRVLLKLWVESISEEAEEKEEAAEAQILQQLKEAVLKIVPDPTGYLESDMNLKRFLDARPTFDLAVIMLANSIRWRNEGRYHSSPSGCQLCVVNPGLHTWRQIGFDKERRPAIFFSLTQVLPRLRHSTKPFDTLLHLINLLDNGHKTMEPGAACGFTWIIDLQGMTWADCRVVSKLTAEMEEGGVRAPGSDGPSKKETFISVLADHYPQTLGSCVMLRPPVFLLQVWKAVRAFMDPKTAKAYYFVRSPQAIEKALDELFEPETGAWIRKEISLISGDTSSESERADGRAFKGPCLWERDRSGHDARGNAEYLQRFCCPPEARAEQDRDHRPHPNLCQMIETGRVGADAGTKEEVPTIVAPAAKTHEEDKLGSSLDLEIKVTSKQECEEARRIIRMTMSKIKKAVDESDRQATATRGKRNAGRRNRTGLSYEALERLSSPVEEAPEKPSSGDIEWDLEAMIDEILKTETDGREAEDDYENEEGEEEEDEDDEEDGDLEADGLAVVKLDAKGRVVRSSTNGYKRQVIGARGTHEERIRLDKKGAPESASKVSWAFQVGNGDVGFEATFRPDSPAESEPPLWTVVPWTRCPNRTVHRGDYKLPTTGSPGLLTIRWDNSYSRVRSKVITFDIKK